jgi:sec-independent protein translocase protein TatC
MSRFRKATEGMTLGEHLAELRYRLMVSFAVLLVFAVVGFILYPKLLGILRHPYCVASPKHCQFLVQNPLDGLTLRVKVGFFSGFLASFPVIIYQVWRFITPGLKSRERKYALPFLLVSTVFFMGGVALAYSSFGHAIQFLQQIGGSTLVSFYNPNQYFSLFLMMMFIFGLMFEFPVVLVAMELGGVVQSATLLRSWRYAIIIITIVSAVVTPSGDPLSMAALAIPLIVFYFGAIAIGKIFRK